MQPWAPDQPRERPRPPASEPSALAEAAARLRGHFGIEARAPEKARVHEAKRGLLPRVAVLQRCDGVPAEPRAKPHVTRDESLSAPGPGVGGPEVEQASERTARRRHVPRGYSRISVERNAMEDVRLDAEHAIEVAGVERSSQADERGRVVELVPVDLERPHVRPHVWLEHLVGDA